MRTTKKKRGKARQGRQNGINRMQKSAKEEKRKEGACIHIVWERSEESGLGWM
jgi:hypothetical protein